MPHRRPDWFTIGLVLIVLVTAAFSLLIYDYGLPYVEKIQEPNYYLAGLEWRGLYDNQGYYEGVPPAYIALHAGLQPILESVGIRDLSPTVRVMRLLSVASHLLTVVWLGLSAKLAGGRLAGLVAAAAWGLSPYVLLEQINALPDPWVYFFVALALWLATVAVVSPERRWWSVGSTIAGLLAIMMKYPAVPALGVSVIPPLLLALKERRRGLEVLAVQALLIAGTAFWLIFIYGVDFNNLQREGAVVANQGLSNMLNPGRLANNLSQTLWPLNPMLFLGAVVLGVAAWFVARRRSLPTINLGVAAMCLLLLVTIPWLASSFSEVDETYLRYVMPATTAACVLFGMAMGQIIMVVPERRQVAAGAAIVAVLSLTLFIPNLTRDTQIVGARRLPDRRVALRQWFDINLKPGTVLVDQENHKTFNPLWGGIPYRTWVDWWVTDNIMEHSVSEWRDQRGMSYAVIPRLDWERMQADEAGGAYLGEMLHLRSFFSPPAGRGPEMVIYRLWLPQYTTGARFGEAIRLIGYDQSAETVRAGDTLTFTFYWQANTTPTDNYSLFIHLVPRDEYTLLGQVDGAPTVPERPTLTWNDPGETLISPEFSLSVPADLPEGEYRVMIGLYNYTSGERLPVTGEDGEGGGDTLELAVVTVDG